MFDEETYGSTSRVLDALKHESNPLEADLDHLNRQKLVTIAKQTHNSLLHMSGNCVLLSTAFLFNLKAGKIVFRVGNTSPFFQAIDLQTANKLFFGKFDLPIREAIKAKDIEKRLLAIYRDSKERVFILYEGSHMFNAVILFNKGEPYVQIVDLWKTSNPIRSIKQFETTYAKKNFDVHFHRGTVDVNAAIERINNKSINGENISLTTFKKAYLLEYQQAFFKNPFSTMKHKLPTLKSMDEVIDYAKKHPCSRTAKVIRNLQSLQTPGESCQFKPNF